jgi:hypothetical protein
MTKKLKGSLYTLLHLANHINLMFKAATLVKNKSKEWNPVVSEFDTTITFDKVAIPAFAHNIYILTCSFLDEWEQQLTPIKIPEYADRILKLKNVTKPFTKRIKKWSSLDDFRNIVLAHNLRVKGEDIFTSDKKHSIKFPFADSELHLLFAIIQVLGQELLDEFKDIELDPNRSILDSFEYTPDYVDAQTEWNKLYDEMIALKVQTFDENASKEK